MPSAPERTGYVLPELGGDDAALVEEAARGVLLIGVEERERVLEGVAVVGLSLRS
jgi:hypothetical protein